MAYSSNRGYHENCDSLMRSSRLRWQGGRNELRGSADNHLRTIIRRSTIQVEQYAINDFGSLNMTSSSAGYFPSSIGDSSSSHQPPSVPTLQDDSDGDDPVTSHHREQALLSEYPLYEDEGETLSFKRKVKQAPVSRFLSGLSGTGAQSRQPASSPRSGTPGVSDGGSWVPGTNSEETSSNINANPKDGGPLDWYAEGPGRRVGYEDMTAIDWIFEYTKERQRLRVLYSSASGLLGYAQRALDASQIWIVLILTGLAAGIFAAAIDVASDWLGDVKTGYCSAGDDGGRFYLNKYFCCYGYDGYTQCRDWVPWSAAVHITSTGGKWFIEYFFFILFSVSSPDQFRDCR
jgi:chloride channel 3/4/5